MNTINKDPIIYTHGSGAPVLVVVGCQHGNEPVGRKIIDYLNKLKIIKGTLITIIANPVALDKKERFIKTDLNRCFPGTPNGRLEEQIAYELLPTLKQADLVVDIHSTGTDTRDVAIIKKKNEKIFKALQIFKPKRVVIMPKHYGGGSLINQVEAGISFEYGHHESSYTFDSTLRDIKKIMIYFDMIKGKYKSSNNISCIYSVYEATPRPKDFKLNSGVKNFMLIKKGTKLGTANNKDIVAKEDFFPVLFGENSYKNILGFKAKK